MSGWQVAAVVFCAALTGVSVGVAVALHIVGRQPGYTDGYCDGYQTGRWQSTLDLADVVHAEFALPVPGPELFDHQQSNLWQEPPAITTDGDGSPYGVTVATLLEGQPDD